MKKIVRRQAHFDAADVKKHIIVPKDVKRRIGKLTIMPVFAINSNLYQEKIVGMQNVTTRVA